MKYLKIGPDEIALFTKAGIAIVSDSKEVGVFSIAKEGSKEYKNAKERIESWDPPIQEKEDDHGDQILEIIKELPSGKIANTSNKTYVVAYMFCLATKKYQPNLVRRTVS